MNNAMRSRRQPRWAQHLCRICLIGSALGFATIARIQGRALGDEHAVNRPAVGAEPRTNTRATAPAAQVGPVATSPEQIKSALVRALRPLEKTLVVYPEKRDCFSCHNQTLPLLALRVARSRGLAVDEDAAAGAVALTIADLESAREQYSAGRGQPGGVTRAAYALWALEEGGHAPDKITRTVGEFLLKADRDHDHWTTGAGRVPIEASHFTTTALAIRALLAYEPRTRAGVVKERVRQALAWLVKSRPVDTEDRVFRLWGLKYAGASPEQIEAAAKELRATQRRDGGWAQTPELASDAYATGSALVSLHEAGGVDVDDPAYRRGIAFLMAAQHEDGTWFVASRSRPFQPYFESGFPYGKDQFIAVAASGWAAAALAFALPPAR
jgi:squalene cyclase